MIPAIPSIVFAQISRRCNLQCVMCGWKEWKRNTGVMPERIFARVLEETTKAGIRKMAFTGAQGEPLLNPDAGKFIFAALKLGLRLDINTNCTTLGDRNVQMLAEAAGMGRLRVQASFSGYDKQSHEKVYVGSKFEVTSRKLKALFDAFKAKGRLAQLGINGIVYEAPAKHRAYLTSIGIDQAIARFHCADNFAGFVPNGRPLAGTFRMCPVLVYQVVVYDDGKVSACACRDSEGVMEIGDINIEGFAAMRKGPRFKKMIHAHMRQDLRELKLCNKCDVPYYGIK